MKEVAKNGKVRAARTFEELHFYQLARELTNAIYECARKGTFAWDRGLREQIQRASVSIMSNIAEGFERGSKVEFLQFLFLAKGSCGEVRAQLQVASDQEYLPVAEANRLAGLARRTSGMMSNFMAHLQSSSYQGEKQNRPRRAALQAHQARQETLQRFAEAAKLRHQRRLHGELP